MEGKMNVVKYLMFFFNALFWVSKLLLTFYNAANRLCEGEAYSMAWPKSSFPGGSHDGTNQRKAKNIQFRYIMNTHFRFDIQVVLRIGVKSLVKPFLWVRCFQSLQ